MGLGRLFLVAVIGAGLAFLIFTPEPRITREGPTVDFVEHTVAVSFPAVHERLALGLEQELESHPDFGGAGSRVADSEGHGFPTLYQVQAQLGTNPALSRYAGLGKTAWKQDFLAQSGWRNWFSEYSENGEPVPFHTDFLIHLEPLDTEETHIEVIEYAPKVIVGTKFTLCGPHLFPGVWNDTLPVGPTTKDRREMLDVVLRIVNANHRTHPQPTENPNARH